MFFFVHVVSILEQQLLKLLLSVSLNFFWHFSQDFCAVQTHIFFYQFGTTKIKERERENCETLRKTRTLWLHLHSLGFSGKHFAPPPPRCFLLPRS